jgi:hypothetical protein
MQFLPLNFPPITLHHFVGKVNSAPTTPRNWPTMNLEAVIETQEVENLRPPLIPRAFAAPFCYFLAPISRMLAVKTRPSNSLKVPY